MMFNINSSFQSQGILNNLMSLGTQLALSNTRLATAQRITTAADDPSGVIRLSQLESEVAEIDAVTKNGQRISNMLDTADGGLSEISDLLDTINTKVVLASDSGATADEKAAYQAEIDSAIDSINRIANTTTFNGTRLLDGNLGFNVSGIDSADLQDVRINSADTSSGSVDLTVAVTSAAQRAQMIYAGGALGATTEFTVTGNKGSYDFSFAAATNVATMETAINAQTEVTGVTAVNNGGNLELYSEYYGDDQYVAVNVTQGTFNFNGSITSDYGVDPTVTVNGSAAEENGMAINFSSGSTSAKFTLTTAFGTTTGSETFTVSGNGANFQLSPAASDALNIGISSVSAGNLGNDSLGKLTTLKSGGTNAISTGNFEAAQDIIEAGSNLISYERGRLGAVSRYTVDSTLNSMAATKVNLASGISQLNDVDVVSETANNQRLNTLFEINAALLGSLNQSKSSILSILLGG